MPFIEGGTGYLRVNRTSERYRFSLYTLANNSLEPNNPNSGEARGRFAILTRIVQYTKGKIDDLLRRVSPYQVDPRETAWTLTHAHFIPMGGIIFKEPLDGGIGFKEPEARGEREVANFFAP